MIDIEAAFLEGKLNKPMFVEWLPGMVELGFLSKKDAKEYVCMLTGGMYGNVQAALGFFVGCIFHSSSNIPPVLNQIVLKYPR